jgi:hypothetical protein
MFAVAYVSALARRNRMKSFQLAHQNQAAMLGNFFGDRKATRRAGGPF